ncbi:MAG TPA: hypothetical protein VNR18_11295 [Hyphomicrobiales bacterium]|nr:hypothetical protein [Hyphomicrobiales bacterium]
MRRSSAVLLSLWAFASPLALAQENEEDSGFFGLGLLERTQAFGTTQADALARRLDSYFGVERSDLEAAYSSLRLITQGSWEQLDSTEFRVRLRGTLVLPRVNERLRLVFSEDKGEGATYYSQNDIVTEQQSTRVNLEVNLAESARSRFDFRVGLRSNLKLRSSLRYRYEQPFADDYLGRLSQTVYFIDGTGYGSFTQLQFDKSLSEKSLLRWSTEFRAQEELNGNEWSTALQYSVLGENTGAISYFFRMNGVSNHSQVDRYQVGFRLRENIYRPWLFWEFSPGVSTEKKTPQDSYETGLFAIVRLEMAIGAY